MFIRKFFNNSRLLALLFVFFVACSTVLLDFYTKQLCTSLLENVTEIRVLPFFSLIDVRNTGMSFGLLKGFQFSNVFFICLNLSLVLLIFLFSCSKCDISLEGGACGLLLGGALGNILDRVVFGAVRDFLDFHVFGWHWPTFNLADGAIFLGVMYLIYCTWKNERMTELKEKR